MKIFERKILSSVRKAMNTSEIIVLTGLRRSGKTSVLQKLYDEVPGHNKVFLDFENFLDRALFEVKDYNRIVRSLKEVGLSKAKGGFVFIDEIQSYPDSVRALKYLYDHYQIKFIVTGSSSFYLKGLFPESLAGRKTIFELYPLDFEEFLLFKGVHASFDKTFHKKAEGKGSTRHEKLAPYVDEYLKWGGFPQVVLAKDEEHKRRIIGDIFSSYHQKDILQLSDFRNISVFRDLLMLLIDRTGSKLDISKLAAEVGISRDTVYSYLAFLEATYMISLVKPYSLNTGREVSGARKVYFCDNGILSVFGKISAGNAFENAVHCNLMRSHKVNYYQKRTGHEIDFVLPESKTALEVKTKGSQPDYNKTRANAEQIKLSHTYFITKHYCDAPWAIPFESL